MLYAPFLQNCIILVNVGCLAVARGAIRASLSFEFQVLIFAISFGFFGVTSTSITAVVGVFFYCPWTDGAGSEFVINPLGISLCRMLVRLTLKSWCIVVNSHNKFTSPRVNSQEWRSKIHRMPPPPRWILSSVSLLYENIL